MKSYVVTCPNLTVGHNEGNVILDTARQLIETQSVPMLGLGR